MRKIIATVLLTVFLILIIATPVLAVLTVTPASVDDWTAVPAGSHYESTAIDIHLSYAVAIQIQAFLDSETAHEGTEFIIQTSFNSSDNEDWSDYTRFTALVGTANAELIDDNPLIATSTSITVSDTTGYTMDLTSMRWIGIEDGTLANSELVLQEGFTTNTSINIVDGTANEHANTVNLYNIAISRTIIIQPFTGYYARVVVNNKYDDDGTSSSLNVRVRKVNVTSLQ